MPHFIIHCSDDILETQTQQQINRAVSLIADDSGLFESADIKVRTQPFNEFLVGHEQASFIHVFAHIMQGRTVSQRADLSKAVVAVLSDMFPEISNIAMNIYEFEKSTYYNAKMFTSS